MIRAVSVDKVLVRDIVPGGQPLVSVSPSTTVDELVRLLDTHKVHGVPVLAESKLVGVVSLADLSTRREGETTVAEIMSPHVFHVGETAPLREAVELMLDRNVHRLVVLRDEEVAGVVTTTDLLRYLRDLLPPSLLD